MNTNNTIKVMNFLAFIPIIGFFIVFYYGFFTIKKLKQKKDFINFCLISIGSLIGSLILVMIIIALVAGNGLMNPIWATVVLILTYVAMTGAGIVSNAWTKKVLEKNGKNE